MMESAPYARSPLTIGKPSSEQEEDEFVTVLQGEAVLCLMQKGQEEEEEKEGEEEPVRREVALRAGQGLMLRKHVRHRVESTSTEPPCVWLCFFCR